MDNDVTTIQRARGWRECEYEDSHSHQPETGPCALEVYEDGESGCRYGWDAPYPDPLSDTPGGWWEFEQILKWAHEKGWELALELLPRGPYHADVYTKDRLWLGLGRGEFRAAIVGAIAAAVRRTSSRSEGSGQ